MKNLVKSKIAVGVTATLCCLLVVNSAVAWGPGGHMIVAQIAYQRLNARAKAEVDKLIRRRIEPTAITRTSLDFVNAAHWPDDLRPVAAFADTLPLHFVDFPISADGTALPTDLPEKDNILTALQKYVDILKSNVDDAQRAQALRFIIHFVGDVHQPLHAATRITHASPEGDHGGNGFLVKVTAANGTVQTVKLHSYWDGGIGDFPKAGPNFAPPPLGQIAPAVTRITAEFPDSDEMWKVDGPFAYDKWAHESTELARSTAFSGISPNRRATKAYNLAALKTVHQRVAWGGYRLAELLNSIWPAGTTPAASLTPLPETLRSRTGPAEIYPDSVMTPGAPNPDITQDNIAENICNKNWSTSSVRPSTSVTGKIKKQTMKAYGFTDSQTHYELDHLLSLQVGGCPACVENLWPQAYGDTNHPMTQVERSAWNKAHPNSTAVLPGSLEKDLVENHVHDEICFGIPNAKMSAYAKKFPPTIGISLVRGQAILAAEWYACYVNMMNGNKPCE